MNRPKRERYAIDDTEPWARDFLVRRWRAMTPQEKWDAMSSHSIALHEQSMASLRHRYPKASEREIWQRSAALRIGVQEFERITGVTFDW